MIQRISSFVAKRFCHASQRIGHIHAQLAAPLAMRAAAWLTVVLLLLAPKVSPADDQADLVAAFDGANAAYQKADYQKATKQFERALALALKLRGENDVDTATILNNVGEMYRMTGKYAQAESLYQRSLKVREAKLGPNHLDVAQTLSNQGSLYVQMGKYTQAEPLLLRSLKIREANTGTDQLLVADTLNNLAELYRNIGKYARAEPLYQRSLKIREAKQGPNHLNVAQTLNNQGLLYYSMGQYAKAEALYQRTLKIYEAKPGTDQTLVAQTLNNLGDLYVTTSQYAEADPLYQRSLKLYETKLGPDHPDVAVVLNNLAALYKETGKYSDAEALFRRSFKIRKAKLPADHPDLAVTMNNMADLYSTVGQYAQAEPLFRSSLKISETKLGSLHPLVETGLVNLGMVHAVLDQPNLAVGDFDRARRVTRQQMAQILPLLSEKEQITFLDNTDRKDFDISLTLGWDRPADRGLAERSASWLANGKAVAQETLAQRAALGRDATDPALQALVTKLNATRGQLARLTNTMPPAGTEAAYQAEMKQLGEQEQNLAKQLSRAGGTAAPATWVELAEIRRNIPAEAILVDLIRFRPAIFKAKGKEEKFLQARYGAWLTPANGHGDVRVVDLGEAARIDTAVQGFQAAFKPCQSPDKEQNPLLTLGEPDAEQQLQGSLVALGRLVLEPLLPYLQDKQEIILSPDASLWLVPWAVLPVNRGTLTPALSHGEREMGYAIEKWNIHYVTSARDLAGERRKPSTNPPRIFANPDYNLAVSAMPGALASVFGGKAPSSAPLQPDETLLSMNDLRGQRVGTFGPVPPLPGTAREAAAIAPNLKIYAKGEPKLYAEKQALETVFKHLGSPRVLVLSTHGFFLPDRAVKSDGADGLSSAADRESKKSQIDKDASAIENPLLRCGLLLAGCNNRDKIPIKSDLDDGVLSGMEIVGTNLRATELVVLSACETGLGQVRIGEGVAGLRQAFQLAGAQSVVATLWQIPDLQSAQMMNDFFANLAAGQSKSEALRNAQLALIKVRREKFGAAHPYFWAAFTLTGQ